MKTLYRKDPRGVIRVYSFEFDGEGRTRIHQGVLGKTMRASRWKAFNPSAGAVRWKVDPEAVARRRVAGMVRLMIAERGWSESLDDVGEFRPFRPMEAVPWTPGAVKRFRYPVHVQPWVEGLRVLLGRDGAKDPLGREILWTHEVRKALAPIFGRHRDLVFDGVLHGWQDLTSEAELLDPTLNADAALEVEAAMSFRIFDAADGAGEVPFDLRWGFFAPLVEEIRLMGYPVSLAKPVQACDAKDVDSLCQQALRDGHRGGMVRVSEPGSIYKQGPSEHLLERLDYFQRDFRVVRVIEGRGPNLGHAEKALLKTPDLKKRFIAPLGGTKEDKREAWEKRSILARGLAVVKFQKTRKDGRPDQPVVVELKPTKV